MRPTGAFCPPPLIAPGQWHLRGGIPPIPAWRAGVLFVVVATQGLMLAWAGAWLMACLDGQVSVVGAALAVLVSATSLILAARWCVRLRHAARLLSVRWCHQQGLDTESCSHWRVVQWGDRPVVLDVVLKFSGWRLLRLSQPGPDPRLIRQAWCWVPPVPSGTDPQDLHRLSCLLTLKSGSPGSLRQPMASSPGLLRQKVPVSPPTSSFQAPETQFADTVFADTVWMEEPAMGGGTESKSDPSRRVA